jgi:hypothetical protein
MYRNNRPLKNRYNVLHSSIYNEADVDERQFVDVWVDDIIKVTPKAILILIDDHELWLPISQVEDGDRVQSGSGEQILAIAKWLAIKNGFNWE